MSNGGTKDTDLVSYDFGNIAPPEGFKADSQGYENAPVGWHRFKITGFEVFPDHKFTGQDFGEWVGNQIRPKYSVVDGQPHAGNTQMDFLPLPTPDRAMPKRLANQWANLIRAFGFQPPANQLVPAGFKLHDLIGKEGMAEVHLDKYDADNPKLRIKFFGYKPIEGGKPGGSGIATKTPAPPPQQTSGDLNLDDL